MTRCKFIHEIQTFGSPDRAEHDSRAPTGGFRHCVWPAVAAAGAGAATMEPPHCVAPQEDKRSSKYDTIQVRASGMVRVRLPRRADARSPLTSLERTGQCAGPRLAWFRAPLRAVPIPDEPHAKLGRDIGLQGVARSVRGKEGARGQRQAGRHAGDEGRNGVRTYGQESSI